MYASDVIKLAKSQVGYKGKKTNSELYDFNANTSGNYNKYALELYNNGYYNGNKNGYSWCCCFVDWIFLCASNYNKEIALKTKNVGLYGASVQYIKGANPGKYDNIPRLGDQILFKDKNNELCHTGIVVGIDNDTITTIEGNTTGSIVKEKTYLLTDSYIDSFVHPNYDEEISTITITLPEYNKLVERANVADALYTFVERFKKWM